MSSQNSLRFLLHELRRYINEQMTGGASFAAWTLKRIYDQAKVMEEAVTGAYQAGDISPSQAVHNYIYVESAVMDALERGDYPRFMDIERRKKDGSYSRDGHRWLDQDRKGFR